MIEMAGGQVRAHSVQRKRETKQGQESGCIRGCWPDPRLEEAGGAFESVQLCLRSNLSDPLRVHQR